MHELIAAAKIGVSTGATMLAATNISANIEDGRISVVVAVTCTVFICGIVWWLSSRFQKIEDSTAQTNRRLDAMEAQMKTMEIQMKVTENRQQKRDDND
jgi:hypothetical protein